MSTVASRFKANKQRRNWSGNGIFLGLILVGLTGALSHTERADMAAIPTALILVGFAIYMVSAVIYVKSKGYPGIMGLLALTGLIGLVILFYLDENKRFHDRNDWSSEAGGKGDSAWTMVEGARHSESAAAHRGADPRPPA